MIYYGNECSGRSVAHNQREHCIKWKGRSGNRDYDTWIHIKSQQVKCGNKPDDSELPSTAKVTTGYGTQTSNLFGDKGLIHLTQRIRHRETIVLVCVTHETLP